MTESPIQTVSNNCIVTGIEDLPDEEKESIACCVIEDTATRNRSFAEVETAFLNGGGAGAYFLVQTCHDVSPHLARCWEVKQVSAVQAVVMTQHQWLNIDCLILFKPACSVPMPV